MKMGLINNIKEITKEDIVEWFEAQKETCYKCPFDKKCDNVMGTYGPQLCDLITHYEDE